MQKLTLPKYWIKVNFGEEQDLYYNYREHTFSLTPVMDIANFRMYLEQANVNIDLRDIDKQIAEQEDEVLRQFGGLMPDIPLAVNELQKFVYQQKPDNTP